MPIVLSRSTFFDGRLLLPYIYKVLWGIRAPRESIAIPYIYKETKSSRSEPRKAQR